ncbi:MAG: sodium:proton antiporter [Coriobacteriales bacterium]
MELGQTLPIWSIIPFAGMLLSIAIFPLVKAEWWERHQLLVALAWALAFLVPFLFAYGPEVTAEQLAEVIIGDYIPFIVLLMGLYVVAGGIHVGGTIAGTTKNNVVILLIGSLLASWVGTTGAAMLLIRPLLRANLWRRHRAHVVVFFIFLVANAGGCLTPLGDPPLFLGYLRGVPFFWTLQHIWPVLLANVVLLVGLFVLVDRYFMRKEPRESYRQLELLTRADDRVPIHLQGWHNLLFLLVIVAGVILNGLIPQLGMFVDPATGRTFGVDVFGAHVGPEYVAQIALICLAMVLSWVTTSKSDRSRNNFEWAPIAEVAKLFVGIFVTMIPALAILRAHGGSLGLDSPLGFFWATGALSSFLDNSPTYVVFLTTAGALGTDAAGAVATTVGMVDPAILLAISAGAVFMGAVTYIGNAPNFMVKSIAEGAGVRMPSFFGYIGWALAFLVPVFAVDSLLFFL